jgi:hypothetical protein
MTHRRINILFKSFKAKFTAGVFGTTETKHLRQMWRSFKRGYVRGQVTPVGELVQAPKQRQRNILEAMGYNGHALDGLMGHSQTWLRKFIRRKNTRVVSMTEVTGAE